MPGTYPTSHLFPLRHLGIRHIDDLRRDEAPASDHASDADGLVFSVHPDVFEWVSGLEKVRDWSLASPSTKASGVGCAALPL